MTDLKSDFVRTLQERGFIHQCSDLAALDEKASQGVITAYIGFDATASSLHVGSLVQIMLLRWLQKTGHKPIVLMGGGTTKVGDPSGKDTQRSMLTVEQIDDNIAGIKAAFMPFLSFSDDAALMANNAEWLDKLGYVDFLRDYGVHVTINRMMTFDSVKLRLDEQFRDNPADLAGLLIPTAAGKTVHISGIVLGGAMDAGLEDAGRTDAGVEAGLVDAGVGLADAAREGGKGR